MNELTKEAIDRILDLNIGGIYKCGDALCYNTEFMINKHGDVNLNGWHGDYLEHDKFKFDGSDFVYLETKKDVDEFVEIVANRFGHTVTKSRHTRLNDLYEEVLGEIVEELTKEYGYIFEIRFNNIWFKTKTKCGGNQWNRVGRLDGVRFHILWDGYLQGEVGEDVKIDDLKVRKAFNVAEELCKIKMPSKLYLRNNGVNVNLYFGGGIYIGSIYSVQDKRIDNVSAFDEEEWDYRKEKFGTTLKPEQEKEYVQWVAETLGGEYNE